MFERVYEAAMRENRPAEYAAVQKSGKLEEELARFDEEATQAWNNAFAALKTLHPLPPDKGLDRAGHYGMLQEMAREIVLHDMLPDNVAE